VLVVVVLVVVWEVVVVVVVVGQSKVKALLLSNTSLVGSGTTLPPYRTHPSPGAASAILLSVPLKRHPHTCEVRPRTHTQNAHRKKGI
jgi:hypothetical protein